MIVQLVITNQRFSHSSPEIYHRIKVAVPYQLGVTCVPILFWCDFVHKDAVNTTK